MYPIGEKSDCREHNPQWGYSCWVSGQNQPQAVSKFLSEQYCWEKSLLVGPDVVLGPKYPLHLKAMLFDLVKKENFYFVSSILNMYIHICNVDMLLNYMCACICEQWCI